MLLHFYLKKKKSRSSTLTEEDDFQLWGLRDFEWGSLRI